MEFTKTITVRWWEDNGPEIKHEHREHLEEEGFSHALEMLKDGFTSGELVEEHEDITYMGWWELTTQIIE